MKKMSLALALFLLVIASAVTPVTAETQTISISDEITESISYDIPIQESGVNKQLNFIEIKNIAHLDVPNTIICFGEIRPYKAGMYSNRSTFKCGDAISGTIFWQYLPASPSSSFVVLEIDSVNYEGQPEYVRLYPEGDALSDFYFVDGRSYYNQAVIQNIPNLPYTAVVLGYVKLWPSNPSDVYSLGKAYTMNTRLTYKAEISYTGDAEPSLTSVDHINLTRIVNGINYEAYTVLTGKSGSEYWNNTGIDYLTATVAASERPYTLQIRSIALDRWYNKTLWADAATGDPGDPDDPDDPSETSGITVYIKNSQTGALIANANVAIDALEDGEYYPVTNRTEPSGIFTINLQPTGGGKPNPDSYRLIVTADGYNNPMPEINFTLGDYIKYFECFLDPIAGGPADENKTFIDFFVRDMFSNPISGATVKFGKYTLITNSAGYTVFEVDKNNNYSWTVSKSGYGALTGNAVIGNDPRHTINTVLAPIVTPTTTTPIPTSPPIGPTPTMTAPTGEPVSNWLEWFAAHFGMILGGGVEIGKIFMWLCFTVPVGVYVGKESKAGAAGFMAGAGIVTLFFVLIGWVPIWLVVLLALIIGLLYAKVFNSPDNGGGR